MRTRRLLIGVAAIALLAGAVRGAVVHVPLVGRVPRPEGSTDGAAWFTETRIWNPNGVEANVMVTDLIGLGSPTRRTFRVPPFGVLDLSASDFLDAPVRPDPLATVDLTSDVPVTVLTSVNVTTLASCVGPFPPPQRPHWDGCETIGGPILHAFANYFMSGEAVALGWLTAERLFYRDNLFITNPNAETLTVTGTFRAYDGSTPRSKTFVVPPRTLLRVNDVFADPTLEAIESTNREAEPDQGAATAILVGDKPFYAFAVVLNLSVTGHTLNRFAIVEPEARR